MAEVITYETLYELARKEKYSPELQGIDSGFFKRVVAYLEEKEQFVSQSPSDSMFSKEISTAKKQLENARKLLKELYERRESKIVQFALLSSRTKKKDILPLLPEEQQLFEEVHAVLKKYRQEVLESMLNLYPIMKGELPKAIKTEKKESGNKLIRFLHPTPKFVATDMKVYGPFEREDISFIPHKVARALIKKKRAEEMKSEKK